MSKKRLPATCPNPAADARRLRRAAAAFVERYGLPPAAAVLRFVNKGLREGYPECCILWWIVYWRFALAQIEPNLYGDLIRRVGEATGRPANRIPCPACLVAAMQKTPEAEKA